jgi:hypothetical protein
MGLLEILKQILGRLGDQSLVDGTFLAVIASFSIPEVLVDECEA